MSGSDPGDITRVIGRTKATGVAIDFPGGQLRAVTSATDEVAALLAAWRRSNPEGFATRFPVTDEGTLKWLQTQVVDNPRRVLLLVVDEENHPIGHLGFMAGDAVQLPVEIDNVLRGEAAPAGFMRQAFEALLDWLAANLGGDPIGLRVLASNTRAIDFYQACGFRELGRINLIEMRDGDRVSLVPGDTDAIDQYVTMARDPKDQQTENVESP